MLLTNNFYGVFLIRLTNTILIVVGYVENYNHYPNNHLNKVLVNKLWKSLCLYVENYFN